MTRDDFLSAVEAFLIETSMKATPFGVAALNDPSFVRNLRDGREPSLRTVDRVSTFMREYREALAKPARGAAE